MSASTVTLGIVVTAAAGAAHGALQSLGQNMRRLQARTDVAAQAHARLGERLAQVGRQGRPVQGLSEAYVRLGRTIEDARRQAEQFAVTQERIAGHQAAADELWGQAMGVAGLGLALAAPVRAAIQFESALADVRKVVDASDAEFAQFTAEIMRMGRSLPLAHTEIAALAASGGQLGVALQDLPAFVGTTARMAVAFDMAAADAGDAMARIANVYNIPIAEIGRLGDAINQISNESPARARDIVLALSRVGGVAQSFGLSADQAAALSGAFIAMGRSPEVAGTAIGGMLVRLQTANQQGPRFAAALDRIGLSAQGLTQAIGQDAQGALMDFLRSVEALPREQRMGVLVDLFGLEYADDVAVLAGNTAVYRAQIDAVARAGGSMEREFAARSATTANNLQLLRNTVAELGINIGAVLLPPLNSVLSTLRPLVEGLAAWAQANPGLVLAIGKLAAALLVFKAGSLVVRAAFHWVALGALGVVSRLQSLRAAWLATSLAMQTKSLAPVLPMLGAAAPAVDGLLGRLREIANSGAPMQALAWHLGQIGAQAKRAALSVGGALKGALLGAGKAALWLGRAVLMNPIGLALTAAALLVWKFWGPIAGFFRGLWTGLRDGLAPVGASIQAAFAPVLPVLQPIGAWFARAAGWVRSLLQPMEDTGGAAEAFGVRVGRAIGRAVQFFLSLPGKLLALPAQMLSLGTALVDGLAQGIRQRIGAAVEAVRSLGQSAVAGLRNLLGIRSPSRVFAALGAHLGQGLAQGMHASASGVAQAAAGLAAAATFSLSAAQPLPPLPALPSQNLPLASAAPANAAPTPGAAGMVLHYAPVLTIHATSAEPGAVREQVQQALHLSQAEFERYMRRYQADAARRAIR